LRPLKGENEPAPKQIYFLDVNADGAREVIVCDEVTEGTTHNRAQGNVICYDEAGKRLWKYELNDSVKTSGEVFKPPFLLFILDTMTHKDRLTLFCAGYHTPYFPTAIFGLDAKTGRRVTGLVWHAGRLRDGVIVKAGDKKLLIATAVSNAFNRPVIFSIDANNLVNSQLPAIPKYEFSALPRCTFEQYVLLPNSDLCAYNGSRYEYPDYSGIITIPERNALEFSLLVSPRYGLRYTTIAALDSFDIIIGDEFKVYRDILIEEKKLTSPHTFDPAYKALLLRALRFIKY
jgi:hypothetical protein